MKARTLERYQQQCRRDLSLLNDLVNAKRQEVIQLISCRARVRAMQGIYLTIVLEAANLTLRTLRWQECALLYGLEHDKSFVTGSSTDNYSTNLFRIHQRSQPSFQGADKSAAAGLEGNQIFVDEICRGCYEVAEDGASLITICRERIAKCSCNHTRGSLLGSYLELRALDIRNMIAYRLVDYDGNFFRASSGERRRPQFLGDIPSPSYQSFLKCSDGREMKRRIRRDTQDLESPREAGVREINGTPRNRQQLRFQFAPDDYSMFAGHPPQDTLMNEDHYGFHVLVDAAGGGIRKTNQIF